MIDASWSQYLLDTNSYFLLFQSPPTTEYYRLVDQIKSGNDIRFYISEITSLEIQSVLGKYRRGVLRQSQQCCRDIIVKSNIESCSNTWISLGRTRIKRKVYRGIQKMIRDIENERGDIKARVLDLEHVIIVTGRKILYDYSDTCNFGSHDSIIIATQIYCQHIHNTVLTLVTSDKGMKSVLRHKSIPFYDPKIE